MVWSDRKWLYNVRNRVIIVWTVLVVVNDENFLIDKY
jgi:hypothetical protein